MRETPVRDFNNEENKKRRECRLKRSGVRNGQTVRKAKTDTEVEEGRMERGQDTCVVV